MAGFDGDYVGLEFVVQQEQVAHQVEDFVANKLVVEAEAFFTENGLVFDDDGVVEAAAFNEAAIHKCLDLDIFPIIGGDMVHDGYTEEEGGYIDNAAPQKMYIDGANFGAKHFVIPCTRLDRMRIYCHRLGNMVNNPILFLTGVGIESCDDLVKACEIVKQYRSYAVIGREITDEKDYRKAAEGIWEKLPVSS